MKMDLLYKEGSQLGLRGGGFVAHDYIEHTIDGAGSEQSRQGGTGKVLLVGAGPNDPELLTVKAMKAIQDADVIVYDRLVNQEVLEFASTQCKLIYVGKRCGQPSLKQEEISQILVDCAKLGKQVVRLKGGDPFIFGRGGEEGLLLAENNIEYQVIPGITAAIGCAASSYIPLTHRKVARSVTFVTGQVVTGALPAWSQLVGAGQTLVFYMGLEKADEIQRGLISNGLDGDFPLAIVTHGCSRQQKVHVSCLSELMSKAHELKGVSPGLIILGEVVKLRDELMATLESVVSQEEV
ncbi:uroporphyrinogen-III C-methyltransferase [Vibrio sp. M260118]|uniref:uroporphyrinogen-III C-methyltransferase n=1 Tax=Vibrio sp. M260118 TaxID=3020896 RepID=UPI002F3F3B13